MTDTEPADSSPDDATDLDRTIEVARRVIAHHSRLAHEHALAHGVNLTDLRLLFALDNKGTAGLLPKTVAKFLGISTGATTSLIDRLEARSYVHRVPNPDDRRSIAVVMLKGGADVVEAVRGVYRTIFAEAMPLDRLPAFADQLEAIDRALLAETATRES
jgi:DNA-binding MarR family transcriptional regulator